MLAPVIAVARPFVVESVKVGAQAAIGQAIVYVGLIGVTLAGYATFKGGRAAANGLTGMFRKKEQPMQAAVDEAKVIFTQSEAEVTELFRKADQAA